MADNITVDSGSSASSYFICPTCQGDVWCICTQEAAACYGNIDNALCHFHLMGICKYGDNCWFSHTSPQNGGHLKLINDEQSAELFKQTEVPLTHSMPNKNLNKSYINQQKFNTISQYSAKELPTCGPGSLNWVNAPEFIPRPIPNWVNAPEFVPRPIPNWLNAPEFVPRTDRSRTDIVKSNDSQGKNESQDFECPENKECPRVHDKICGKNCLNPFDEEQRKTRTAFCERKRELEEDPPELSFAIQRSLDKTCGICMDVIMEKEPASERRFGILEKCNHVFCLECIKKWRRVQTSIQPEDDFLNPSVTHTCPECRVSSDFFIPSEYWIGTEEEKVKILSDFKMRIRKKPCKYFIPGKDSCPFKEECFYRHANPAESLPSCKPAESPSTNTELSQSTRRRSRQSRDVTLWDYLEGRLREREPAVSDDNDDESNFRSLETWEEIHYFRRSGFFD